MYSIGKFSKITGISIPTLRYYDERRIIIPRVKKENGYRYYEDDQLLDAQFVNNLKRVGLSLEAITDLITAGDPAYTLQRIRELKYAKLNELKQLTDIENYYARGVMGRKYNGELEGNAEVSILRGCEYISKEIDSLDAKQIFTVDCMELQKKRDSLGLIQKAGICVICNSLAPAKTDAKDMIIMPVSLPEDISRGENAISEASTMDARETISTVICRSEMDFNDEIKQLSKIAASMGRKTTGAPVLECLLDPGDMPNTDEYIAKIHLNIE